MDSFDAIRPLIVSVDGDEEVRVALEWQSELYVGTAAVSAAESPAHVTDARLVAGGRATLHALDQLTPNAVAFTLEWGARVVTAEGLPHVIVALPRVEVAGVPMRYAGAVIDDGSDAAQLAAKATLDALNRRLGVTGL